MGVVMNLGSALKDKNARIALGAGGALGVFVLLKKRGAGSSSGAGTSSAGVAGSSGSSPVGTSTFNDGGTDIAATLGNFSTELQGILGNYAGSLQNPTPLPPKTTTPAAPDHDAPKPVPKPTAKPAPARRGSPTPPTHAAPTPARKVITIRRGDTLSALAQANHTTVPALAKLNGIQNPNLIIAGKQLRIS